MQWEIAGRESLESNRPGFEPINIMLKSLSKELDMHQPKGMSSLHVGRIGLLNQVNTNGIVVPRKENHYTKNFFFFNFY